MIRLRESLRPALLAVIRVNILLGWLVQGGLGFNQRNNHWLLRLHLLLVRGAPICSLLQRVGEELVESRLLRLAEVTSGRILLGWFGEHGQVSQGRHNSELCAEVG